MADGLAELFEDPKFRRAASLENLFNMLETLDDASMDILSFTPLHDALSSPRESEATSTRPLEMDEGGDEASLSRKKLKFAAAAPEDGQGKISHITVERNRRKQMNEHLSVLRSLMPCFYVKRGDQASIIGGVVDYITELHQVLQSLEAKKQRKVYSEVLSPRPPVPLSPRPSPLSPRIGLPISPRTPHQGSPYKPRVVPHLSPANIAGAAAPSFSLDSSPSLDSSAELAAAANSKSPVADVEVKFSGPNVLLNTVSHRIPGQTTKIITVLEGHSLEILQVNINSVQDSMLISFTIKIGIECELSAEELAQEILQTFS